MPCFNDKKRIVVKIGSSSLAYPETGSLNIRKSRALVEVLADLKNSGKEIVFVTSGVQCVGAAKGGFLKKPQDTPFKTGLRGYRTERTDEVLLGMLRAVQS